jgi:uncharacterized protein YecT (DUF1311 family)
MLILSLAVAIASAQADEQWNCADPQAQAEMNACAGIDFERADAELNRLWRTLTAGAQANDRSPDSGRSETDRRSEEEILRRGQRAWVQFRDAQCEYEGLSERGGSMETLIVNQCLARLTRQRIAQLRGEGEQ